MFLIAHKKRFNALITMQKSRTHFDGPFWKKNEILLSDPFHCFSGFFPPKKGQTWQVSFAFDSVDQYTSYNPLETS